MSAADPWAYFILEVALLEGSTGGLVKPELPGPVPSLEFIRLRQHPGFYISDKFPAKVEATGQGHVWRGSDIKHFYGQPGYQFAESFLNT